MDKQMRLTITGKVQGVFYRSTAKRNAMELKLKGYVKNIEDGSVVLVAEGPEEKLDELLKWCWTGPENAEVRNIEVKWFSCEDKYPDFSVRY
jgi:acylphosphatase